MWRVGAGRQMASRSSSPGLKIRHGRRMSVSQMHRRSHENVRLSFFHEGPGADVHSEGRRWFASSCEDHPRRCEVVPRLTEGPQVPPRNLEEGPGYTCCREGRPENDS